MYPCGITWSQLAIDIAVRRVLGSIEVRLLTAVNRVSRTESEAHRCRKCTEFLSYCY